MPRPRTEAAPSDAPRRKTEPQLRSRRCPAEYYPSGLSGVGDLQRIKKGGAVLIPMRRSLREAFHHPRSRRSQYSWSSALADSCSCARAAAARRVQDFIDRCHRPQLKFEPRCRWILRRQLVRQSVFKHGRCYPSVRSQHGDRARRFLGILG